ncbi:MAG: TIGR00266 family protein [Lachnospiraceae bacterium]|nr:TIGR00266 family protein [Lachnospiraceae bacterium]
MKYNIEGDSLPVVTCNLEAGERMITESGAMSWMSPNMKMETVGGGVGKMLGRMFSGESLFLNHYTAMGGPGMIAFASSFPGSIRAFEIMPGRELVCQKSAFLASTSGIELSTFFQKRIGGALFGGEGFIMQRLSGQGIAFVEFDGHVKEYELGAGQSIIVDTGYLAAMDSTCTLDIQTVPGVKNMFFGGEGVFNTVVSGPGKVYLQSMPINQMASTIWPYLPVSSK